MINLSNFKKECKDNPISLTLAKNPISLGNNVYKLLCSCSHNKPSFNLLKKAIKSNFEGKVSIFEGTVKNKGHNLISMMVGINKRSVGFEGELPKNKKRITATLVADINDDTLWDVVTTDSGEKRLVLKDDQDFNKLFENSSRVKTTTAAILDKNIKVDSGDYVSYFDTKSYMIKSGYAFVADDDSITIIDKNMQEHEISEDAILDATDLTSFNKNPITSATNDDVNKIMDYLKVLYKDTDFYNKLDELVGVNNTALPKSTMILSSLDEEYDLSSIKGKIKNYLINEAIKDLEAEVLNDDFSIVNEKDNEKIVDDEVESETDDSILEETDEVEAEGDIDFATNEELRTEDFTETSDIQKEDAIQFTGEDNQVEIDVDNPIDFLDTDSIEVKSEEELDDGEFEDVQINDMSNEELLQALTDVLNKEESFTEANY